MKYQYGDIICFSGTDWISWLIRIFTKSEISHVGIMADDINMLEAVTPTVRLIDLDKKIKEYKGKVIYCKLNKKSRKKLERNKDSFDACIKSQIEKPYDLLLLLKFGINIISGNKYTWKENTNELICSEANAQNLESCRVLSKGTNDSKFTPKDIYELPIYENKIILK